VGALVVVAFLLIARQAESTDLVIHTLDVQNRLTTLLSRLQDAETGQRGFLLTGDTDFLQPYESALTLINQDFTQVKEATADNSIQQAALERLKPLIDRRMTLLRDGIESYRRGERVNSALPSRLSEGKSAMDQVRLVIAELSRAETALLQQRQATATREATWTKFGLVALALTIIGLAAATFRDQQGRLALAIANAETLARLNTRLRDEAATREAAESQVRQLQKIESIGQLTGGIAHDFNNMLAIVIGSLDLAKRRLAKDLARAESCIDNALDGAHRAAQLTARLLAFSRQQPLEPRVIDANKLVGGMSEILRRTLGEHLKVETVLAGGLWRTNVDSVQLESAILNLAVNARDAMPDGGHLTIETSNAFLDDVYASTHVEVSAGQYVLISISDTGTGMPAEVIARAFEPFYSTKGAGKGTGLGLSQVYGFVKQTGGHVKIYSEPGHGTTVKIYLPRHVGAADVVPDHLARANAKSESLRGRDDEIILVVEDDESVRHFTVDALRELGYTVIQAEDAKRALSVLSLQPRIDLLFTDIIMPDTNGRKLAEQVVQLRPTVKVLYTTGYTRNAVVHNGVLDAEVAFIAKPFTVDQLAAKVRQVLDTSKIL